MVNDLIGAIAQPRVDLFLQPKTGHLHRRGITNAVQVLGRRLFVGCIDLEELAPRHTADLHRKRAIVGDEAELCVFLASINISQDMQRIGSGGTVSLAHANNSLSGCGEDQEVLAAITAFVETAL